MKKDDIIGGVMLLVVIVIAGAFFLFAKEAPQLSYGPVEVPGTTLTFSATPSMTEVDFSATLIKSGFITIHESMGGAPGTIIGASRLLTAGSETSYKVMLSTPMTPEMQYVALVHVDNGDGIFIVTDDMPVTSNGVSVRADFVSTEQK